MLGAIRKLSSDAWASHPYLSFLVSFDVVCVHVKLIDRHFFASSLWPIDIHSRQPEPIRLTNQDSILALVLLEDDSIGKIKPLSNQSYFFSFCIELKQPSQRIVH